MSNIEFNLDFGNTSKISRIAQNIWLRMVSNYRIIFGSKYDLNNASIIRDIPESIWKLYRIINIADKVKSY